MGNRKPTWAWVRAHWLDVVIPVSVFLLSAAVYREVRWGQQNRRLQAWETHFNAAARLQNAQKTNQALEELVAAAEVAPDDPEAHRQLARAFQGARLPDRATHHMEMALRFDRPNRDAAVDLARIYCDLGRYADADRILKLPVVTTAPRDADVCFLEGLVALYGGSDGGRPADAERLFAEALRLKPDHVAARFRHGVSLARLARHGEAEREFRAVLRDSPSYVSAYKELAETLRRQSRVGEAERYLARLQVLDDVDQSVRYIETRRMTGKVPPEDLLELGKLYLSAERLQQAEGALVQYVLVRPTDPRGHRLLAQVHGKMKLPKNAAADLQLATALENRGGDRR